MQTVLLLGGAGFVGSCVAHALLQQGYQVVIIDLFLHHQVVDLPGAIVIRGDFGDQLLLKSIFTTYRIAAVMHFAAFIEVGRSVHEPAAFYDNNVIKTKVLLDLMQVYGVKNIVFSSSCAIYSPVLGGQKLTEQQSLNPLSPYGKTKCVVEFLLQDYARAYDMRYVSLRYFNAAGALPAYGLGEQHTPETHVIPLLFKAAIEQQPFTILGQDYPTPDGTCVRDYIHVKDLAVVHGKALHYLLAGGQAFACNVGSGVGYSVKELVALASSVSGQPIQTVIKPPRAGDVPYLVADVSFVRQRLDWRAEALLPEIMNDAWLFYQKKELKNNAAALNLENS
jgi:UDP-glucose 4-epimerase